MSVTRDTGTTPKRKKAKCVTGDTRRPTVAGAARTLKVSRQHLSAVIHGHRASRSLTERYQTLLATEGVAK